MTKLYRVHTIIPKLHGCKDVAIKWFVYDRKEPVASYPDVIVDYDPAAEFAIYSRLLIDELFTEDEASRHAGWLNEWLPQYAHRIKEVTLPVANDGIGYCGMSVGGPTGFADLPQGLLPLSPLKIRGCYDLRDAEALPDVQSDLERRRSFKSNLFSRDPIRHRLVCEAELEKIKPIH